LPLCQSLERTATAPLRPGDAEDIAEAEARHSENREQGNDDCIKSEHYSHPKRKKGPLYKPAEAFQTGGDQEGLQDNASDTFRL
jgi:hypothetical protein